MSKVLFVNPPLGLDQRYGFFAKAGGIEVPLGLCFLAAMVRQNNMDAEIIDAQALKYGEEDILKIIQSERPRAVGFSATTAQIQAASRIAEKIKKTGLEITTVIGGPHVSALPQQTLADNPFFDIGVVGEGEMIFKDLLCLFERRSDFASLRGLVLRRREGIIYTGDRPRIKDIDSLPFPAFELLPSLEKHYYLPIQNTKQSPGISLTSSRGCVGQCSFCDRTVFGRHVTFHSPDYLMALLALLKKRYQVRNIMFQDDNFFFSKDRAMRFCRLLKESRLDIHWSASARIDSIDAQVLKAAKSSGCWQLSYGIESADETMLDAYKKNIYPGRMLEVLQRTQGEGILTKGFFIFGGPGETEKSLRATADFTQEAALNDISVTFFTPYPGTEAWRDIDAYGHFDRDFSRMTCFDPVFTPCGLTKERLLLYRDKTLRSFYFRLRTVVSYFKRIDSFAFLLKLCTSAVALGRSHRQKRQGRIRLIVSADDFGLSQEVNQGVIQGYKNGIVRSASIMPNADGFKEAASWSRENTGLDIGLHLTLIEEKPLSLKKEVPSLVDKEGYFFRNYWQFLRRYFCGQIDMAQVRHELDAQFEKALREGIRISHVDSHQHIHMIPGVLTIVLELAQKHNIRKIRYPYLPFRIGLFFLGDGGMLFLKRMLLCAACWVGRGQLRRNGFVHTQYYCNLSGGELSVQKLTSFLAILKPADWEVSFHPAVTNIFSAQRYSHWGYDWKKDWAVVTDGRMKALLEDGAIQQADFPALDAAG